MKSDLPRSIAIMFHERDTHADREVYRIWPIAENWRRLGIDVRIVHGPDPCLDADVLVPHLDCTIIPEPYWQAIQAHPRAVNARLKDISKTRISEHLLSPASAYDGPVIVKTNRNSGGFKDLHFGREHPQTLGEMIGKRLAWHPWLHRFCWGWTQTLRPYPIYPHLSRVPPAIWRNPHLVVEKFFTPDQDEAGHYVLYMWIKFGNSSVSRTLLSNDLVAKSENSAGGTFESVPLSIQDTVNELGCDYGKIDFIFHGGKPVLLDINRTPSLPRGTTKEMYLQQTEGLARGIADIPSP